MMIKYKHIQKLGLLCLLLWTATLSTPAVPVRANGLFFVNSALDNYDVDDVLTLPEAIMVANGTLVGAFTDGEKAQLGGCTFTGSSNNWTITGGCGAGIPDTIGFSSSYTISLNNTLETLTDDGTIISALTGQDVQINGNGIALSIFRITGSDIIINNLKLYGTADYNSTIWVFGSAQRVEIANNVIGDDDAAVGGCGQNPGVVNGIKVNSTGFISSGARTWTYGNVIECNENGNGIVLPATDEVIIGEDYAGNAGNAQRNFIRLNGVSGVRLEGSSGNAVRNSRIVDNGESGVHLTNSSLNRVLGNTIAGNGDNGGGNCKRLIVEPHRLSGRGL